METKREIWIDWMRVAACFMVMLVHCTEPFYLGGEGSLILTKADAFWSSFFDSFVRACVPLFVVASSYLQFPVHYSAKEFFRRRAVRILIPFAVWSVVYALAWGEPVQNFKDLLLNFNYAAGHLWFVYMIAGLYIIMPLLSPWAEKVGRKELLVYLLLCFATTLIPYVRELASGGDAPVIYGPSGIPNPAKYPLWGEASWNTYGLFYYLSGFLGYLFLGLYLRKFVTELSWGRTLALALPSWLAGFGLCFGGFVRRVMDSCGGVFPVEGPTGMAAQWETPWFNDTVGVALMTLGWILLFRKISSQGAFYRRVLLPVSKAGYGMYLIHLLVLVPVSSFFRNFWGIGADAAFGVWTTPVQILLSAVCTFIIVASVSVALQRIPKAGKYIIG